MSSNISFYPKATNKQNWIQLTIDFTIDTVAVLDASIKRNKRRLRNLILLKRFNTFISLKNNTSDSYYWKLHKQWLSIADKVDKTFVLSAKFFNLRYPNVS